MPGYPLAGSYLADYVVVIISTAVYSVLSSPRTLASIPMVPISLFLLQLTGDPAYLLFIPAQIAIVIALSRPSLRLLALAGLIGSIPLSHRKTWIGVSIFHKRTSQFHRISWEYS
jgi:hypothetical protein